MYHEPSGAEIRTALLYRAKPAESYVSPTGAMAQRNRLDLHVLTNPHRSRTPGRLLCRLCVATLAVGVLFDSRPAHAYRPFDGTDGDVADFGEFELELGPIDFFQQGKEKSFLAPTVLNFGILPRMELVFDFVPEMPLQTEGGPQYRVGDTDIFAKALLRKGALQEETGPSIAVEGGALLPEVNGARGLGASLNLIVSERWGWLTVHLNNEAELSRSDLDFGWTSNLIGEADLGGPVRPVAELGWATDQAGAQTYTGLAGAIWSVSDGFELDAAGVIGSIEGELAFEGRVGLTWAIEGWAPTVEHEESEPGAEQASVDSAEEEEAEEYQEADASQEGGAAKTVSAEAPAQPAPKVRTDRLAELEAALAASDARSKATDARLAELERQVPALDARVAELTDKVSHETEPEPRAKTKSKDKKDKKAKVKRKHGDDTAHNGSSATQASTQGGL